MGVDEDKRALDAPAGEREDEVVVPTDTDTWSPRGWVNDDESDTNKNY